MANIDYAIRRDRDHVWLHDDNGDGTSPEWEMMEDMANTYATKEEALTFAMLCGVADNTESGIRLHDGISVVPVEWEYEEDIEPDELDRQLDMEDQQH